ncbi:PREDICTED: uncharacterized protein LOC109169392 [Ipomoea nil]|uniref:uncharacterized protein LOC109169392 n=1 Tax=Ipomoea nil TaxID=35883 RepID=UPI000901293D|nr:PREDICTED: uncharacterized protein LOC109169392 [Ipomoea nil]
MAENNRVGQLDDPVPPIVPPPQYQAAQPRLRDIQRPVIAVNPSCIQLSDAARNYELKTFHLNILPTFNGLGSEDALGFMRELYSTVQTLPLNNLSEEELRMKCFPYCMRGDARQWLLNLPEGSLRTWDDVYNAFMFKYYSSQKTMDYRSRICTFTQREDTAAGGYTCDKNSDELEAIYESLASNSRQKAVRGRRAAVHEISTQSELTTQVAELTKQMNLLMTRDSSNREFCSYCNTYGHNSSVCMNAESSQPSYEEVNYMGSNMGRQQPRNDPFSNTYNPGWRNHPNFSWRDQGNGNARPMGPPGFQQQGPSGFQHQQYRPFQQPPAPQQSQLFAQEKKPQLEEMEGAMAVTLRSGKILNEIMKENEPTRVEKESDKEEEQVPKENSSNQNLTSSTVKPYVPPIPYPQRLQKRNQDNNFKRFLEVFKKLQINIPFAEALANMPSYAKYIKEIVSNKKKLEEFATVHLNEECSAILQSKLPPKLMDPGSFSIPCTIGNTVVDKCLCDLGASINLMHLTLFNKLEIAEMKPTTISLQLADRSVKYPLGVVEDILVKVGKLYFPADFLILDMGSDTDTSLILGRPFLLTGGVLIDMPLGKLIFRVGKEKEEFSISKVVKLPTFDESCLFVDVIEKPSEEKFFKHSPSETPHQLEFKPPSLRFKYEFLSDNDTFLMFSYAHLLHAKEERLWRTLTKAWHDKIIFGENSI